MKNTLVDFHLYLILLNWLCNMFSKYINIPYKNLGRDFDGVDCYGEVWLIFKESLRIELSDFTDIVYEEKWYNNGENHILNNINKDWRVVLPPYRRYDCILFYLGSKKVANHIGLYIGNNKFIHVYENNTSMISRLDKYWHSKIYKTIRHRKVI